jgi:Resolvase, N terminal domain
MQPDVSLIYNSRNTDQDSVVGYGWSLSIPYIERLNKTGSVLSTRRTHLKLLDDTDPSLVIPISDSTLGVTLESMESMKKAVLYARVSSDAQQKEGTIESQIVELKKQITAAGHELVKEYVDDGLTGTLLDRPALEQLRQDAKTDLFDRIYFSRR